MAYPQFYHIDKRDYKDFVIDKKYRPSIDPFFSTRLQELIKGTNSVLPLLFSSYPTLFIDPQFLCKHTCTKIHGTMIRKSAQHLIDLVSYYEQNTKKYQQMLMALLLDLNIF